MRESITVQEKGSSQQSKKDNKCKATHKFSSKVRERWTTDEARQRTSRTVIPKGTSLEH